MRIQAVKSPLLVAATAIALAAPATAGSLQVAPVLLDVPAPAKATTVTLRNTGAEPVTAQVRVFRWIQDGGEERLEPTTDVVASPPVVELRERQDYIVRVIRVSSRPLGKEEAYRLILDELPRPRQASGHIALVMRHVVPVFFASGGAAPGSLVWRLARSQNGVTLSAQNTGDTRRRLAAVKISDSSGQAISASSGLLGYALGGSLMSWTLPAPKATVKIGASVIVSGVAETGPFHATVPVQASR